PRAITSAMAGTTRDVLSAPLDLPGGATTVLLDAAGFGTTSDPLAPHATQAARAAVARADVVLMVVDAARSDARDGDRCLLADIARANPRAPQILLANKADLPGASDPSGLAETLDAAIFTRAVATSAQTGLGLDEVRGALRDVLDVAAERPGGAVALHARQRRCLLDPASAATAAAALCRNATDIADVAELAAVDLRDALARLGAVSGEVVTDDILGRIFARFCVGK
ncbi:MAG: 50S ribosome-binding GTPase, partial [Phycisphaerae bacterium]|nr:50S ribosome-binding GTPase [Phycisphaerae bacterium]